ncbi:DUF5677 domain-containing protein [uncultured Microbulbifer sp.]|uniref:DUF5677 domain-containing protein n=1 Tax=uncultured Microbulbifer sp. TaxID=348147 RepID=UPI00260893C7|nr:DUF5677 domain-containing protein [uncultured Microbulbifer sp.]
MEKAKAHYLQMILEHESHSAHIPIIAEVFQDLKVIADTIDIEEGKGMDSLAHRIQVRTLINAVTAIMSSIVILLKEKHFEGVDPLGRVVLEHSINIMYLFIGKPKVHSKQFVRNYIDTTLKKSERWHAYTLKSSDEIEQEIAENKLKLLKKMKNDHPGLYDGTIKKWPNAHDRFLKVGHESAYVTLFAMNSDSIHGLSEDVYNNCLLPNYPDELAPYVMRHYKALSSSMSIYLAMKSVAFFGLAINAISERLKSSHDIEAILVKLNDAASQHEGENLERWLS